MKHFNPLLIALPCILIALAATASTTNHTASDTATEYRIQAYNNCNQVADIPMTAPQITLYQKLETAQKAIEIAQSPIEKIEQQINAYSTEISAITELAVVENEHTLTINKTLLAKQEQAAKQLKNFIAQHQADFDRLEKTASQIESIAQQFEESIKPTLGGMSYQYLQVVGPNTPKNNNTCNDSLAYRMH